MCGPTARQVATTYGAVQAEPHLFLTSAPDQLHAPTALLPGKSRRYLFYKRLGGQPSYRTNLSCSNSCCSEGRLAQLDIPENDSKHKQVSHNTNNFHFDHLRYRKQFSESLCSGRPVCVCTELSPRLTAVQDNKSGSGKTECPRYCVPQNGNLHPPGHSVTAAVLGSAINDTVYITELL